MARWKDLAPRQESTSNQGGKMTEQRGVVLHIAEGSYGGTISWQQNPTSDVSSHFIKGKNDGEECQMVDTGTTAWTQKSGNGKWISIENAGSVPDKLTASQVEFAAQILARAHREYGVPLQIATSPNGRGLGHHSMGCDYDWGHCSCPGTNIINQKSAIVARAKEIVAEGSNDMGIMEGVTKEGLKDFVKTDDAVPNLPWRADYRPLGDDAPPTGPQGGTNQYIMWETWFIEMGQETMRQRDALARIEAAIASGVEVDAVVKVDAESVTAIAEATADELHERTEA